MGGRKVYLEERGGGRQVGPHDVYEVVVDSWINKNLNRVVWHFTKVGKARRLVDLARALGIEVWIGN